MEERVNASAKSIDSGQPAQADLSRNFAFRSIGHFNCLFLQFF